MKQKILLVEDEWELREVFVSIATSKTSSVLSVDSAAEAEKALQRERFTKIVTDDLEGEWVHVVACARKYAGAIPIALWAWDTTWQGQAEKMGIRFVDKAHFSTHEMTRFLRSSRG